MAQIIIRRVETCNCCGAWNSFRKGKKGKSLFDRETQTRRIYGECSRCGKKMTVIIRPPPAEMI